MMLDNFIRIVGAAAVYLVSAFVVLVAVLAIWGSYHHTLRNLGSPMFVFSLMLMCLGTPVFWIATTFVGRALVRNNGLTFHFTSVIVLYVYALSVLAGIFAFPPRNGLEGGDIAIRLSVIVATVGIVVNAVWTRRNKESPTNPCSLVRRRTRLHG